MEEFLIFSFLYLLKVLMVCKNILSTHYYILYEKYDSFKLTMDLTIDSVKYFYYFILTNFTYYKVEPSYDNWACVCYLNLDDKNNYYYTENYTILKTGLENEELESIVDDIVDTNMITIYENTFIKDVLLIVKYNGLYYINLQRDQFTKKISKVKFLSIEYIYKNNRIEIVLPKEMYVVGNELFSPIFILRCLEYQEKVFEFNKDYTLNIMDGDLNNIQITSECCIILEDKTYSIKNIMQ